MLRTSRLWQKLFRSPLSTQAQASAGANTCSRFDLEKTLPSAAGNPRGSPCSGTDAHRYQPRRQRRRHPARTAILTANGDTGDTIVFDPSLRYGPIDLTSSINNFGASPPPPSAGPTAFDITSSMTIQGSGQVIVRDAAASPFRLFTIETNGNLTLSGLTLEGGFAQGGDGGGTNLGGGGGGAAGLGGMSLTWETLPSRIRP